MSEEKDLCYYLAVRAKSRSSVALALKLPSAATLVQKRGTSRSKEFASLICPWKPEKYFIREHESREIESYGRGLLSPCRHRRRR